MKSFQWTKQEKHRILRNTEVEMTGQADKQIHHQIWDQNSPFLPKAINTLTQGQILKAIKVF